MSIALPASVYGMQSLVEDSLPASVAILSPFSTGKTDNSHVGETVSTLLDLTHTTTAIRSRLHPGIHPPLPLHDMGHETVQTFTGVTIQMFNSLADRLEKSNNKQKARLTFIPNRQKLIVEWATPVHEHVTELRDALYPATRHLSDKTIRTKAEMGHSLKHDGFMAVPDLTIVSSLLAKPTKQHVSAIVGCAFSQDLSNLNEKIRSTLERFLEIAMVVVITITEERTYRCPEEGSEAWVKFSREGRCLGNNEFMALNSCEAGEDSEDHVVLEPFIAAHHTWCHITDVQYSVWVRDGASPIDIDTDTPTIGTLYPGIEMQDVECTIKDGLRKVQESIASTLLKKEVGLSNRHLSLLTDLPATLAFDWPMMQLTLRPSADSTAAYRYQSWYKMVFASGGDSGEEYDPSSSEDLDS